MAASIRSFNTYEGSSSTTSHDVPFPATISAGDTLLMLATASDNNTSITASGFTLLDTNNISTLATMSVFWKKATGSESGNLTLTIGANENVAASIMAIQDATDPTVTPPTAGIFAEDSGSTAPDAGNCNPGVPAEYLWLWFVGSRDPNSIVSYPSTPTTFTAVHSYLNMTSSKVMSMGVGEATYTAAALNAAAGELGTAEFIGAQTIAVHPAAGGGGSAGGIMLEMGHLNGGAL